MSKILVTGAHGFIGNELCQKLSKFDIKICGTVRKFNERFQNKKIIYKNIGEINKFKNWKNLLKNYDCVVHCAGLAHKNTKDFNVIENYYEINVECTKKIAEACVKSGVKRFIFLSSIGVLGVNTNGRRPFSNHDQPNPTEYYSKSKLEAEIELMKISKQSKLEVVILRLPLVYGPKPKGNMAKLLKLVNYNFPLPFKSIRNKRSFIGIDNLTDLIFNCIYNPNAPGKTFLVSDGIDLSTPELIKYLKNALGKKDNLFPFPFLFLRLLIQIIGKKKEFDRLTSSLQIDCDYTKKTLNWSPSINIIEGINRMVEKN